MTTSGKKPVLLFDGVCNLCNRWVNFVIDRDPQAQILFAPLQSGSGRQLLEKQGLDPEAMDTVVLIDRDGVHQRSDAVLRIAGYLRGPVRLVRVGAVLPRSWRDALYDLVARKRYRWFGRRDACRIPEPGIRERFLEMDPPSDADGSQG